MSTLRTEALILRAVDFGESDRILHLLVPSSGRVTAIAKGARRSVRRFSGTLDLFGHLRVQLERRRSGMARLEQATLLRSFGALRTDSARFGLGCYLLELLDRLAPEGAAGADARRLFTFALGALGALAAHPADARLRILLELRALEALGLRPELRQCVRCGQAVGGDGGRGPGAAAGHGIGFHVGEGGPVCPRCARDAEGLLPVRLGTLRALEQALRFDVTRLHRLLLAPDTLEEAHALLSRFQRFHLGVELRSERVLDELLGGAAAPARRAAAGDALWSEGSPAGTPPRS